MAPTLAVDQPRATLPARISIRAATVGQLIQGEPSPPLKILMSPTQTSSDLHPLVPARASRSSSFPTEMLIPVTRSSDVLVAATILAVARSCSARRLVNAVVLSLSLSQGTSRMRHPVIAFLILTLTIPTSASETFCPAVASTSA